MSPRRGYQLKPYWNTLGLPKPQIKYSCHHISTRWSLRIWSYVDRDWTSCFWSVCVQWLEFVYVWVCDIVSYPCASLCACFWHFFVDLVWWLVQCWTHYYIGSDCSSLANAWLLPFSVVCICTVFGFPFPSLVWALLAPFTSLSSLTYFYSLPHHHLSTFTCTLHAPIHSICTQQHLFSLHPYTSLSLDSLCGTLFGTPSLFMSRVLEFFF